MSDPRLYILAGSNGAGKTTFATQFLPRYAGTVEFINADLIARGISPFDPDPAAMTAGRIALARFDELARNKQSFAIETTLSGRVYAQRIALLQQAGYQIHLFFLWIPNTSLALRRIRQRVRQGGHNVPAGVVRRRYGRTLQNLVHVYWPMADFVQLVDNSGEKPRPIAEKSGLNIVIFDIPLYNQIHGR